MEIISTSNITQYHKLSKAIGKKVISANGQDLGKVKDIAYDLNKVIGIFVDDVLIGREYIERLDTDSVILKVTPVTSLVGKMVFDKDGKKIGRVIKINRSGPQNDFVDVMVRKSPLSKTIRITKQEMEVISKNIILKVAK